MIATSTAGQVKIGHQFFTKIKADYADWQWALIREFLQNCFDAPGCRNVNIQIGYTDHGTVLTVSIVVADGSVRTFLQAGKQGLRGAPANLTDDQILRLNYLKDLCN